MKLKTRVIETKKSGQKRLKFKVGGLHATIHTPIGTKISASKRAAALSGAYGQKGKAEALFAKNVLHH